MYPQKSASIFWIYVINIFFQNQRVHKIFFNRNCIKVSYSYTKTMKINNHNKNILGAKPSINISTCNSWDQEACPLSGQCQIGEVVYESTLSSNQPNYKEKKYFGIAEESPKGRPYNHNSSFRNDFYKNDTEFSKELWQIRKCYLCLNEKLEIVLYEGENLLNKKTELISKCRHQIKFMLLGHDSKEWNWRHF